MLTKDKFQKELFTRCIDEMYQNAQPPCSYEELVEKSKQNPDERLYAQHYLSVEETRYIIDKYVDLYNLQDSFKDHCDLLIEDMLKGCSKDKYIHPEDGCPSYRGYEKVQPLTEEIGQEAMDKVIEFIKMRKDFYRFNRKCDGFRFEMYNYAPCSNLKTVVDYYTTKGTPVEIVERPKDDEYLYSRYYE